MIFDECFLLFRPLRNTLYLNLTRLADLYLLCASLLISKTTYVT